MDSHGSHGPPAKFSPEALPLFSEGIHLILSRWTALRLVVENEWGGQSSCQKFDNLVVDLISWFTASHDILYIDKLETMLDENMLASFNAEIENGSIKEGFARNPCLVSDEGSCGSGERSVDRRRQRRRTEGGATKATATANAVMADKGKGMMSPLGSVNVESSSSSVNTATLENDNPQQPLWRYVKKLGKGPGGGGNKMFNCNFCEVNYTGSYTRVKAHLLHIACVGIRPCPKLTKEEIDVLKKEHDAAETKKSSSKSSVSVPVYAIEPHEDASKRRRTLSHAFNNMGRAEMDRRIGRFFFASSLPFNVARSPYWKDIVTEDIDVDLEGEHDLHALNMDLTEPVVPSNLDDEEGGE
ncbi:Pre-rRNA-processing TSR2-like protein [Nymphaea thermarum]|nr:Pre-rRNA-processing TSR2-like protein [Nymphaea thermarum]